MQKGGGLFYWGAYADKYGGKVQVVDSKESGWSYIFVVVYGADARR